MRAPAAFVLIGLAWAAPAGAAELSAGVSPASVPSSGATAVEYALSVTTGDAPEHLQVGWARPLGRAAVTLRAPRLEGAGTMGVVAGWVADPTFGGARLDTGPFAACPLAPPSGNATTLDVPAHASARVVVPATIAFAAPPLPGEAYEMAFTVGGQKVTTPGPSVDGPTGALIRLDVVRQARGRVRFLGLTWPALPRQPLELVVRTVSLRPGPFAAPAFRAEALRTTVTTDAAGRFSYLWRARKLRWYVASAELNAPPDGFVSDRSCPEAFRPSAPR